ncbi:MAG: Imm53 family immunity protein, partial [Pirellulaceae bacterium]
MNELEDIEAWYRAQCDGDWEHSWGVKIGTLDNPGWSLEVNLVGTSLEEASFEPLEHCIGKDSNPDDEDWYVCK